MFGIQLAIKNRIRKLERLDTTPADRPAGDHYAHAPGRVCGKCDQRIRADQIARRRGESDWVHDLCPPVRSG